MGPADNHEIVYLNGHKVEVRQNLHSFLRHARCDADAPGRHKAHDARLTEIEWRERYLDPKSNTLGHFWVDALCIDQNNIPEKNLQVSKMKDIYEGAKRKLLFGLDRLPPTVILLWI